MKTRNDLDYANSQPNENELELTELKEELDWWRTYGEYENANYSGVCAEASAYADGDID